MSVKTTVTITRDEAIDRLSTIYDLVTDSNYNKIDELSYEPQENIEKFVNDVFLHLEPNFVEYTNKMLEEKMDLPFFRFSVFDNYLVVSG